MERARGFYFMCTNIQMSYFWFGFDLEYISAVALGIVQTRTQNNKQSAPYFEILPTQTCVNIYIVSFVAF